MSRKISLAKISAGQAAHAERVAAEMAALEALDPRQRRVVESRKRLAAPLHMGSGAGSVRYGEPHPGREAKARHMSGVEGARETGFSRQVLIAGAVGLPNVERSKARAPMQLTAETRLRLWELAGEIEETHLRLMEKGELRDRAAGTGIVDRAIAENPEMQEALSFWVEDYVVVNHGFRIAEDRRAFCHLRMQFVLDDIPLYFVSLANVFAEHVLQVTDWDVPSPAEVGKTLSGYTGVNVGHPCYVTGVKMLAAWLNERYKRYKRFETIRERRKNGIYGSCEVAL
jgi:hypothetical protein